VLPRVGVDKFRMFSTITAKGKQTMFYVCQINDNLLGAMTECPDIVSAFSLATRIISENGVEVGPEVLKELEEDYSYLSEDEEWSVCIGIPNHD